MSLFLDLIEGTKLLLFIVIPFSVIFLLFFICIYYAMYITKKNYLLCSIVMFICLIVSFEVLYGYCLFEYPNNFNLEAVLNKNFYTKTINLFSGFAILFTLFLDIILHRVAFLTNEKEDYSSKNIIKGDVEKTLKFFVNLIVYLTVSSFAVERLYTVHKDFYDGLKLLSEQEKWFPYLATSLFFLTVVQIMKHTRKIIKIEPNYK